MAEIFCICLDFLTYFLRLCPKSAENVCFFVSVHLFHGNVFFVPLLCRLRLVNEEVHEDEDYEHDDDSHGHDAIHDVLVEFSSVVTHIIFFYVEFYKCPP